MSPLYPFTRSPVPPRRAGLTLVELLISITIITMTVGALGVMGRAVQIASEHNQSYGTATQHARVVLDRLARTVQQAHGNAAYAGAWVVEDVVGSYNFPDTLVVWHPATAAANPDGAPLASELKIFCPDPAAPGQLVEITVPGDSRAVPSPANAATFKTFIVGLKTAAGANKVQLTNLVRVASASASGNSTTQQRGAVRFVVELNPSAAEWVSFEAGTTAWNDLSWPQGIAGPNSGMRHVWVRSEIQLLPAGDWHATGEAAKEPVPFFGSATFCYELQR